MESDLDRLAAICIREAGKTWLDAIAEVREAVDFLRYYALLAERQFEGQTVLAGPVGEINTLALHGRGVFACISPWNFPWRFSPARFPQPWPPATPFWPNRPSRRP